MKSLKENCHWMSMNQMMSSNLKMNTMKKNTLPLPSKKKRKSRGESQTSAMPSLDEENRAEEEEVLKLDFFLTSKEMPDDGAM
eukprot:12150271-Ditylum_brightwellii.AAC.1